VKRYQTQLRCPVCDEVMDVILHPDPEPNVQAITLLQADGMIDHLGKSPSCQRSEKWGDPVQKTLPDPVEGPDEELYEGIGQVLPPYPEQN
jgi:hypothetical protein